MKIESPQLDDFFLSLYKDFIFNEITFIFDEDETPLNIKSLTAPYCGFITINNINLEDYNYDWFVDRGNIFILKLYNISYKNASLVLEYIVANNFTMIEEK